MKNFQWIYRLPTVLAVIIFTLSFVILDLGIHGELKDPRLQGAFFSLRAFSGWFTDRKFMLYRGVVLPKSKIVIVKIDDETVNLHGRWPWRRDITAHLIDKIFAFKPKAVGLDMVFAEPDKRLDAETEAILRSNKLDLIADEAEKDPVLAKIIEKHQDRLVLGWSNLNYCRPSFETLESCPVMSDLENYIPPGFEKSAVDTFNPQNFDPQKTSLVSLTGLLSNFDSFSSVSRHGGFFTAFPDTDGFIRRVPLVLFVKGKPYPALALAMARAATGKKIEVELSENQLIRRIGFEGDALPLAHSPLGVMEVNFSGPKNTYPSVAAFEILTKNTESNPSHLETLLKDAYVLVGVTAVGANDYRAFPFDHFMPGTEGHANILDNILNGTMLRYGHHTSTFAWIFLLMTLGAGLLAYFAERLEPLQALALFALTMGAFFGVDVEWLFKRNNVDWPTGFLYAEMAIVFVTTLAAKYILEEKNKKFLRLAFSKYVDPAIVDSIIKDPTKLAVGGEKRDMTILFSDIRGFTTFSEGLDAPKLAKFLNDYLSIMTNIVFENQGTLDKYIGDAVMAFWGAPILQPLHAANAAHAAIQMQKALALNRDRYKQEFGVTVDIGIGLNSGSVNVGNMGSERIFEYTVIGDHVNLASRLEGLTKYYGVKIVTSRFTFDEIQKGGSQIPAHRVLDFVKVKGKKQAIELIEVICDDLPVDGLKCFAEARQLYSQRKWDEAISAFGKANQYFKDSLGGAEDTPSILYMERCQEFKTNSPTSEWDGSWEMQSK